ncbi:zinc finger BED domain-containing protein RICESLEEPER 2-like protein [Tanacetum coccineum]
MYEPQYSDSFQHTTREDSLVEIAAPPPWSTAWTNEEEIALCKGWVHVSENNAIGNARREFRFWTNVLRCMENKTKALGCRTYDMMNGKWKTMRPNVAWFCGVYTNVIRRAHASGARDKDYFAMALLDYEAEHGMSFTLRHCWEVLRKSPKWMDTKGPNFATKKQAAKRYKTSGSSSFNTEFGDASINLNVDVDDDKKDEVHELSRPMGRDKAKGLKKKGSRSSGSSSSMNDEALDRLMVFQMAMHNERAMEMKKEERLAFLEIRRRGKKLVNESWQCRNINNVKRT